MKSILIKDLNKNYENINHKCTRGNMGEFMEPPGMEVLSNYNSKIQKSCNERLINFITLKNQTSA